MVTVEERGRICEKVASVSSHCSNLVVERTWVEVGIEPDWPIARQNDDWRRSRFENDGRPDACLPDVDAARAPRSSGPNLANYYRSFFYCICSFRLLVFTIRFAIYERQMPASAARPPLAKRFPLLASPMKQVGRNNVRHAEDSGRLP